MRHLTTAIAAITLITAFAAPAGAQEYATDRGSLNIGGTAGVSSYKASAGWNTNAFFNPQLQYFVSPGLGIGAALSVHRAWRDAGSFNSYSIGPSVAYYFGRGAQDLRPYLGAQASFARVDGSNVSTWGYGGSAGLLYMLTESVGLDTALFYRRLEPTGESLSTSQENVGFSVGISAFVF